MHNLTIHKTISLKLTADEWELYTSKPGCEEAAAELNAAVENAVNAGLSRREVYDAVAPVFRKYEDLGARDTEPLCVVEQILDTVFPNSNF